MSKKRFYNQDNFMGSKDRVSKKNLKEGLDMTIHMRHLSVLHVESNIRESVLPVRMVVWDVVIGFIR